MDGTKKTGFIPPQTFEGNHILGSVGIALPVIKADEDWTKYLPTVESQLQKTFDSSGCTCYGTTNAIETLEKFLYSTSPNYSDRYVYNAAEIAPPGADPHQVATTIRGAGLVNEEELPDETSSLAEFMTPRPLSIDLRLKGQEWLRKRQLGHQWLWTLQPPADVRLGLLKEALLKGTVCVSVDGWYRNSDGLYYSPQGSNNGHWTHVYNIDDTGIYVFDSYLNDGTYLKKLTLDHNIQFAKVYFFTTPTEQQNWLSQLITKLLELVGTKLLELVGLKQKQLEIPIQPMTNTYEEVKEAVKESMIVKWAKAIAVWEGDKTGVNPGNLKYTFLTTKWGATKGRPAIDGGYFALFKDYQTGFDALCKFLDLGCKDQLRAFHQARTFEKFMKIYAGNPPQSYIDGIRKILDCSLDTDISTFL